MIGDPRCTLKHPRFATLSPVPGPIAIVSFHRQGHDSPRRGIEFARVPLGPRVLAKSVRLETLLPPYLTIRPTAATPHR
jgi:hypothetical protein